MALNHGFSLGAKDPNARAGVAFLGQISRVVALLWLLMRLIVGVMSKKNDLPTFRHGFPIFVTWLKERRIRIWFSR